MLEAIGWLVGNIGLAFVNLWYALSNPAQWLAWTNGMASPESQDSLMRFVYYGASTQFFFVVFTAFLVLTAIGLWRAAFMWACVRVLEGIANGLGRIFAWAGLLMVLQQIVIVFMQRIFAAADISLAFGSPLTRDVSWWAEELKLYNAIIVCMCVSYTFVQGGHVRVDLFYAAASYRAKRVIDMFGALVFMMPAAVITWKYGWFFMWRHLVTPKVSASDKVELMMRKAPLLKWSVETIGFSPNGFDGYFLFKMLLVAFAGLVFLQSIAFFYRSFLEWREGPRSEGKFLDSDLLRERRLQAAGEQKA
ncbi:MAG: TRAP transporter small permease subunit [Rhodobacteraceae bacterium]|nr:TRAP transporter small permease subunit [Paracoccaceae bacterium]